MIPFFGLIGKRKGNQRSRNTSKNTVSPNKLHICHCRRQKGNRKRSQYHCQICGKPVLKFNMKHHYTACAEKEMKEVRYQKEKYSKWRCLHKEIVGKSQGKL